MSSSPKAQYGPGGRGWHFVREKWKDSLDSLMQEERDQRHAEKASTLAQTFANTLREDVDPYGRSFKSTGPAAALTVQAPSDSGRAELARAAAEKIERALAHIISNASVNIESLPQLKLWTRVETARNEVRLALTDAGWSPQAAGRWQDRPGPDPSTLLVPKDWWRQLSVSMLSDLILDSFINSFCDTYVDGAIYMEVSGASRRVVPQVPLHFAPPRHSSSEPDLGGISATMPYVPFVKPFDQMPPRKNTSMVSTTRSRMESTMGSPSTSVMLSPSRVEGFVQQGLPRDSHQAWCTSKHYSSSPALKSWSAQIQNNVKAHRPARRQLARQLEKSQPDEPDLSVKYVEPMTASHFPEHWKEMNKPKAAARPGRAGKRASLAVQVEPEEEQGTPNRPWLMTMNGEGKTNFPYSLASHRAFFASIKDPALRDKAKAMIPLKMTATNS